MLSAFMQSRRGLLIAAALLALILILAPARVNAPDTSEGSMTRRADLSPTGVPTGAQTDGAPSGASDSTGESQSGGALPGLLIASQPDGATDGLNSDGAADGLRDGSPSGASDDARLTAPSSASADDSPASPGDAVFPSGDGSDGMGGASPSGIPAGIDLSARTQSGCMLHRTLFYAPCGHSVQRREPMPAQLIGLSWQALEAEIGDVLPGAMITGFSASEVDATFSMPIPCPLHWVLDAGESGSLIVLQNRDGEALSAVRETDVPLDRLTQEQRAALPQLYDDVQALEGVLESLGS